MNFRQKISGRFKRKIKYFRTVFRSLRHIRIFLYRLYSILNEIVAIVTNNLSQVKKNINKINVDNIIDTTNNYTALHI